MSTLLLESNRRFHLGRLVSGGQRLLKGLAATALAAVAVGASAETLLMPDRDFLKNTSEVVWGITTKANGTAYTIDYGDGATGGGTVADHSYIAFNHTYSAAGTYTVTLTVGTGASAEPATATVRVFDGAVMSAADLRGLNINRAIEDGLRYLWQSQGYRSDFDTNRVTYWPGYSRVATAFVVLAFENHGYKVPNGAATPTGIYPKYLVQRGLNYLFQNLTPVSMGAQPGGNPCVGSGADGGTTCTGLYNPDGNEGYGTAIAALPILGSSAMSRTVEAGLGGSSGAYLAGKTYSEVAQRLVNTIAWGMVDGAAGAGGCVGRGGWYYSLRSDGGGCVPSDGSTVGWNVLALSDAAAAGVTAPPWTMAEFDHAYANHINATGSFDYNADGNPSSEVYRNLARAGIGLQASFYLGKPASNTYVQNAISFINARWSGVGAAGDYTDTCNAYGANLQNKGCAYGMYNAFKGLKLYGVSSLPAAADWYAEYQDWLVANQQAHTNTGGGYWNFAWSCCYSNTYFVTAVAELILAPVALVSPDPELFRTVGLSPLSATNPIGITHTVTAIAQASNNGVVVPVPGVTVNFKVVTGPNAGKTGSGTTGVDGKVSWTYSDTLWGLDTIQAFIGNLGSNTVTKLWQTVCDVNHDGKVTMADLTLIRNKAGQTPTGAIAEYDANGDGKIDVADVRYCQLRLTP